MQGSTRTHAGAAASAPAVVVDMGSYMTKAGLAGDERPRAVFPTTVGFSKYPRVMQPSLDSSATATTSAVVAAATAAAAANADHDGAAPNALLAADDVHAAAARRQHLRASTGGDTAAGDVLLWSAAAASRERFVGARRLARHRGLLRLAGVVDHGLVTDWNLAEDLWHHIYEDELRGIQPQEHPVLVADAPLNPLPHRERLCEMLFETFQVPALQLSPQAVLALYASGRTTGTVLDVGEGVTQCVSVVEGFAITGAIQRSDLAGSAVTERLRQLLSQSQGVYMANTRHASNIAANRRRHNPFLDESNTQASHHRQHQHGIWMSSAVLGPIPRLFTSGRSSTERDLVRRVKEAACYVARDPVRELRAFAAYQNGEYPSTQQSSSTRHTRSTGTDGADKENTMRVDGDKTTDNIKDRPKGQETSTSNNNSAAEYVLPDGQVLRLGSERFESTEVLFEPWRCGMEELGMHELVLSSVMRADADVRGALLGSVVLAGGTTLLPGFGERVLRGLRAGVGPDPAVRVFAPPERAVAAWVGGSVLASAGTFRKLCVDAREWREAGASAVQRRFGTWM